MKHRRIEDERVPGSVDHTPTPPQGFEGLMRRAVGLTKGTMPHPNPRVGALVIAPSGEIVSGRAHAGSGESHAEAAALEAAGPAAAGSTVVVTLEPCIHQGRTPPCTEAIIRAGVARVVVGATDPDSRVAGKGIAALRTAGVDVVTGIEAAAVVANDPAYFHHRRSGRPLVTLKVALTLDGQAAAADGTARWITGPEAREDGHRIRAESDAILVGAGTVIADDPRLDVRIDGYAGPQPRPVIFAGRRPIPAGAALLAREPIVFVGDGDGSDLYDGETIRLPGTGGVDVDAAVRYLGDEGMLALLIEGGPMLGGAALRAGVVDRVALYYGAKLGGGVGLPAVAGVFKTIGEAREVAIESVRMLGPDIRVDAIVGSAGVAPHVPNLAVDRP